MSTFIKQMINHKLKQITPEELLRYAHQYHFVISQKQAKEIVTYLQQTDIDPFDPAYRAKMFEELADITDRQTAEKAQALCQQLITAYGLDKFFK